MEDFLEGAEENSKDYNEDGNADADQWVDTLWPRLTILGDTCTMRSLLSWTCSRNVWRLIRCLNCEILLRMYIDVDTFMAYEPMMPVPAEGEFRVSTQFLTNNDDGQGNIQSDLITVKQLPLVQQGFQESPVASLISD